MGRARIGGDIQTQEGQYEALSFYLHILKITIIVEELSLVVIIFPNQLFTEILTIGCLLVIMVFGLNSFHLFDCLQALINNPLFLYRVFKKTLSHYPSDKLR